MYSFNSKDYYMRRAFNRIGWTESAQAQFSHTASVKWDYSDSTQAIKSLRPLQFYNHFPDSRELTTKQGLNKTLNAITS